MPYSVEPRFDVTCHFQVADNCKKDYTISRRTRAKTLLNNGGKIICLPCSRKLKASGRNNPNVKYDFDDNLMENVNTKEKAYLLGWVASDGHLSKNGVVNISVHSKDIHILEQLRDIVCVDLPITSYTDNMIHLSISSTKMNTDICNHLSITPGKKSYTVQFPHKIADDMKLSFIAGYFDGDGTVRHPDAIRVPECSITSKSEHMLKDIGEFINIPYSLYGDIISWHGNSAIDMMHRIYSDAPFKLMRKYNRFIEWCMWIPALSGRGNHGGELTFRWQKALPDAVPPIKKRASDSGYDLTVIKHLKTHGNIEYYDTGIQVIPEYGWYFQVFARSSFPKTGYMIANNVGIIDRTYTGNIIIALIKVDENAPDLELPARVAQMIPMPIAHFELIEIKDAEQWKTERGSDGFGSTGQIQNG